MNKRAFSKKKEKKEGQFRRPVFNTHPTSIGRHILERRELSLGASGIGHVRCCTNKVQPTAHKQYLLPAPWSGIRTTTGESTSEMPADFPGRKATYQLPTPRVLGNGIEVAGANGRG